MELTKKELLDAISIELEVGDKYLVDNEPELVKQAIEDTIVCLNENTELYSETKTFDQKTCKLGCPIVSILRVIVDGEEAKQI